MTSSVDSLNGETNRQCQVRSELLESPKMGEQKNNSQSKTLQGCRVVLAREQFALFGQEMKVNLCQHETTKQHHNAIERRRRYKLRGSRFASLLMSLPLNCLIFLHLTL